MPVGDRLGEDVRKIFAFRVTDAEKAELQQRAKQQGLSLGRYLVLCGLGQLEPQSLSTFERLDELESRIELLERRADLGVYND